MKLVLGAGRIDRVLLDADRLLQEYRQDSGYDYLNYRPITPRNKLVPEDLAVTLLVNSRATYKTFQSIQKHGESVELHRLPDKPLELSSDDELQAVAQMIAKVASWDGFAASIATKVLHKKRPALIPMLDNQAIFGAYMNWNWPSHRSLQDSVKSQDKIEESLRWIRFDLTRPENLHVWSELAEREPTHTLIEIFDSVWWMYFRNKEPVR